MKEKTSIFAKILYYAYFDTGFALQQLFSESEIVCDFLQMSVQIVPLCGRGWKNLTLNWQNRLESQLQSILQKSSSK